MWLGESIYHLPEDGTFTDQYFEKMTKINLIFMKIWHFIVLKKI